MAFLGLWIEPYPFSKRTPVRFDGGKGQLDIVELATCFLELGDEAALGTLPLSSLVYITRTEIGFFGIFNFIGRLRAYLIGAHVAGLVIPWAAGNAWAIGGSHGSHWGNRRWELTCDILRWLSKSIRILWQNQNRVLHFLHFFLALSLDSGGQPDVHRERQSNKQNSFCSFV